MNIFYIVLDKMNNFVEEGKLQVAGSDDIAEEYMKKRTDAYQIIENFNIIKRILSVCMYFLLINLVLPFPDCDLSFMQRD